MKSYKEQKNSCKFVGCMYISQYKIFHDFFFHCDDDDASFVVVDMVLEMDNPGDNP